MVKYRVYFQTHASTSVEVEAPDSATPDEIADLAAEADFPTLCHHCVGGGRYRQSLELGDVWEPVENVNKDGVLVPVVVKLED